LKFIIQKKHFERVENCVIQREVFKDHVKHIIDPFRLEAILEVKKQNGFFKMLKGK
jgi:hypothetical protein